MTSKRSLGGLLGIGVLLVPTYALATGDPAVIFIVSAIVSYQLSLVAVILGARSCGLRRRLNFSLLYLVFIVALWVAASGFIHYALDQPGHNTFEDLTLTIAPVIFVVILRYILTRGQKVES